jgi:hypothetical protein
VDRFVAISEHIRARIQAAYGREADVVYPPVAVDRWTPRPGPPGAYDLVVSALVPYKRVDLAVRAYSRLGFPLRVVGTGGEQKRLRALAGPNVTIAGWQPDERILEEYRGCRALVFPGEEDFGIVPVEAQACGKPVIALARGGALETVREGVTGVFFREQTEQALLAAVRECARRAWDAAAIRAHAEQFGPDRFLAGLTACIERCLRGVSHAGS